MSYHILVHMKNYKIKKNRKKKSRFFCFLNLEKLQKYEFKIPVSQFLLNTSFFVVVCNTLQILM